jgi:hypothetical protein
MIQHTTAPGELMPSASQLGFRRETAPVAQAVLTRPLAHAATERRDWPRSAPILIAWRAASRLLLLDPNAPAAHDVNIRAHRMHGGAISA